MNRVLRPRWTRVDEGLSKSAGFPLQHEGQWLDYQIPDFRAPVFHRRTEDQQVGLSTEMCPGFFPCGPCWSPSQAAQG